jgi:hypothetical protein
MSEVQKTGRLLTVEECEWLNIRGFSCGMDVDTCDPQLSHIVPIRNPWAVDQKPICNATTLWMSGMPWNQPRANGSFVDEDRRVSCVECLSHLVRFMFNAEQRLKLGYAGALQHKRIRDNMESFSEDARHAGRYDLAMLADAIRVAYSTETQISELVLREVMSSVLSLKSDRIAQAMYLLSMSEVE